MATSQQFVLKSTAAILMAEATRKKMQLIIAIWIFK